MKLWNHTSGGTVVDSKIVSHRKETIDLLKQYYIFNESMANGKNILIVGTTLIP